MGFASGQSQASANLHASLGEEMASCRCLQYVWIRDFSFLGNQQVRLSGAWLLQQLLGGAEGSGLGVWG